MKYRLTLISQKNMVIQKVGRNSEKNVKNKIKNCCINSGSKILKKEKN